MAKINRRNGRQISGSIGSIVFAHNRGGAYIRTAASVDKHTTIRHERERQLSRMSENWSQLGAPDDRHGTEYARQHPVTDTLGEKRPLTGHQCTSAYPPDSTSRHHAASIHTAIKGHATATVKPLTRLRHRTGGVAATFTITPTVAPNSLYVQGALVNSAGIVYVKNVLKLISHYDAPQTSPLDFSAEFDAVFGTTRSRTKRKHPHQHTRRHHRPAQHAATCKRHSHRHPTPFTPRRSASTPRRSPRPQGSHIMAILKPGALGTATGSIGSITLASGRGSTTVRSRGRAPNRSSTAALQARANLATAAALWRSPSMDSQRPAWINYARRTPVPNRFGVPRLLSGFQWFMHYLPILPFLKFPAVYIPAYDDGYIEVQPTATLATTPTLTVTNLSPYKPHHTISLCYASRFANPNAPTPRPFWQLIGTHYQNSDTVDFSPDLVRLHMTPLSGETWLLWLSLADAEHLPSPPCIITATAL